jgi:hypothetical protein
MWVEGQCRLYFVLYNNTILAEGEFGMDNG